MTAKQFKIKYPQYSHLEGDDLWNAMEDSLLQSDNVLYADPKQKKQFLPPIKLDVFQDNVGAIATQTILLEDPTTTRWLNKDGKLVRIGDPKVKKTKSKYPTESYKMVIWDANETV